MPPALRERSTFCFCLRLSQCFFVLLCFSRLFPPVRKWSIQKCRLHWLDIVHPLVAHVLRLLLKDKG